MMLNLELTFDQWKDGQYRITEIDTKDNATYIIS